MGVRISVGVPVDIERPFVTDVLAKVSRQNGKGRRPLLNLISLQSSQLLQFLRLGEIDLLLTTRAGVDHELETLEHFSFPVGAFASKTFFYDLKNVSHESVLGDPRTPFVLPSRLTNLRPEIDRYFIQKKSSPVCVSESNIMSSVVRAALDGMGITILPHIYVARELQSEKLISISKRPLWHHRMALLSTRTGLDEGRRSFAAKFIQHLNEVSQQTMPWRRGQ